MTRPHGRCTHIVIVGASTGGTRVLQRMFEMLPPLRAAILIVQHMPSFINASFTASLARAWHGEVRLAEDGDTLEDGVVLVAPSERQCALEGNRRIRLYDGPKVNFVSPSIDVAMLSVTAPLKGRMTGILLTGMGRDGAQGLLHLRQIGATTLVQDEESSAVYGMPKEAVRLDAANLEGNPEEIVGFLSRYALPGSPAPVPLPVAHSIAAACPG